MSQSRWRNKAAPIIARVLVQTKGQGEDAIAKALYDAYPFGERRYHPYKVWLDEIRKQRGGKSKKVPSDKMLARLEEIRRHNEAAGEP